MTHRAHHDEPTDDLAQIAADDAFLDALARGETPPGELGRLLAAWRDDVAAGVGGDREQLAAVVPLL
ncbi:anti-sigma-D factor RsdA, partial [Streptomyces sp. NPDC088341]|uniref:anti-sigma-D factor RsdA n=2 Tax=Actinomycetes TaxID=1760 RepID=UPI003413E1A2